MPHLGDGSSGSGGAATPAAMLDPTMLLDRTDFVQWMSTRPPPLSGGWEAELALSTDPAVNEADPLGDGDQSEWPATSVGAAYLSYVWGSTCDTLELLRCGNPHCTVHSVLHPFVAACFLGRTAFVRAMIGEAADDNRADLMARRWSGMRFCGLHFAALGASRVGDPVMEEVERAHAAIMGIYPSPEQEHLKVMRMLLEAGAHVDPRDVCGYTPLHIITHTPSAMPMDVAVHADVFAIATLLGEYGADPNACGRIRHTEVLAQPVAIYSRHASPAAYGMVTLLLEMGANPRTPAPVWVMDSFAPPCTLIELHGRLRPELLALAQAAQQRLHACGSQQLVGQEVELHSLPGSPGYEAARGVCVRLDPVRGRYVVDQVTKTRRLADSFAHAPGTAGEAAAGTAEDATTAGEGGISDGGVGGGGTDTAVPAPASVPADAADVTGAAGTGGGGGSGQKPKRKKKKKKKKKNHGEHALLLQQQQQQHSCGDRPRDDSVGRTGPPLVPEVASVLPAGKAKPDAVLVRADNLRVTGGLGGQRVVIVGMTSQFNGRVGHCRGYNAKRQRFRVDLDRVPATAVAIVGASAAAAATAAAAAEPVSPLGPAASTITPAAAAAPPPPGGRGADHRFRTRGPAAPVTPAATPASAAQQFAAAAATTTVAAAATPPSPVQTTPQRAQVSHSAAAAAAAAGGEQPARSMMVAAANLRLVHRVCAHCGFDDDDDHHRKRRLRLCPCLAAAYCTGPGKNCQARDRRRHRLICKAELERFVRIPMQQLPGEAASSRATRPLPVCPRVRKDRKFVVRVSLLGAEILHWDADGIPMPGAAADPGSGSETASAPQPGRSAAAHSGGGGRGGGDGSRSGSGGVDIDDDDAAAGGGQLADASHVGQESLISLRSRWGEVFRFFAVRDLPTGWKLANAVFKHHFRATKGCIHQALVNGCLCAHFTAVVRGGTQGLLDVDPKPLVSQGW